jgi:phosphoribosylformylglycinamidine cyclo-ligase
MHAAVGDAEWFADARRSEDLASGFAEGCHQAGAVWGGGETPTLKGIVNPETIVLAGSAIGRIRPKANRIAGDLKDGDVIVLVASSGVQTNGLTLCRAIAQQLPQGYLTPIEDGRTYGEALLDPSVIYVKLVAKLIADRVKPRYAVHITGHGWRKLMRLAEPFVYHMTNVGDVPPVLRFIQKAGPVEPREAYATFNMGAGFAVYVRPEDADATLSAARATGYKAWVGGHVRKQGDRKAVVIEPLDITFEGDTLRVR